MNFPLWLVSIAITLEILAPTKVNSREVIDLSKLDNRTGVLISHRRFSHRRYGRYRYTPRKYGRLRVYRGRHYRVYSPRHQRYSRRRYLRRYRPSFGIFIRF